MGGRNLNSKKSWDPTRRPNQERLWKLEMQALEERRRIEERRKEIAEEKRLQELRRLQDNVAGAATTEKVDWMYNVQTSQNLDVSPEMESYLLGKRKIVQPDPKNRHDEHSNSNTTGTILPDTLRHDPLLAIRKHAMKHGMESNVRSFTRDLQRDGKDDDNKERGEKHRRRHKRVRHHEEVEYSSRKSRRCSDSDRDKHLNKRRRSADHKSK